MAQVWTQKQQNFVSRWSAACVALLAAADTLNALCTEFSNDTYGTGGANALTDVTVQAVLPAATALQVAQADLSFRLILEIRNRLSEAYQDIMKMQV